MEPKKTEKDDLTKKSGLFVNIGLVVALLIAVLAFEHKVADRSDVDDLARNNNIFEEIIEVPPTDQPPPPPPKVQQPQIVEVPDEEVIEEEIEIDMDNEITEETKIGRASCRERV